MEASIAVFPAVSLLLHLWTMCSNKSWPLAVESDHNTALAMSMTGCWAGENIPAIVSWLLPHVAVCSSAPSAPCSYNPAQLISTLLPLFSQDQPRAAQIPTILYLMEILIWMDVLTLLKPGPVKLNEMY